MAPVRHINHAVANGAREAPAEPCSRCGVRADVGCKHRPAQGAQPLAIARSNDEKPDGRKGRPDRNLHSFWGKGGNPTKAEFARYAEAARQALAPRNRDDE